MQVIGALFGRLVGLIAQYVYFKFPDSVLFGACPVEQSPFECIIPGIYAMVGAAAALAGVTRMTVSLAVISTVLGNVVDIVFELTGSLTFVIPIMVAILVSKWVSEAIESQGIYDLVINLNDHPYLDTKRSYVFTSTFADLCTPQSVDERNIIDVSGTKDITAEALRRKVEWLKGMGGRDSGFPIVKEEVLIGYISASELEYALGIHLPARLSL